MDVVFSDHIKSWSRKLPTKSLWVKKTALSSNSSSANASNCVNNVLAGDGVVMVSRSGSRSVVPTAAVLAAELIKRTTPLLSWGPEMSKEAIISISTNVS